MADEPTTEGQSTGADTQEPKSFTQEQLDAIITDRLKRERDKQGQTNTELQDKLAAFEKAEEERARQAMSEQERQKADLEAAQAERDAAKAEADQLRERIVRTDWILENAPPELPRAYRLLITGAKDEELNASLETVTADYQRDFEGRTGKKPSIGASSPGAAGQLPEKEAPDAILSPLQRVVKAGQAGN